MTSRGPFRPKTFYDFYNNCIYHFSALWKRLLDHQAQVTAFLASVAGERVNSFLGVTGKCC